jgi:hypothetical protein
MYYIQVLGSLFIWVYDSAENPLGFYEIEPAVLPLMEQWPWRTKRAEGLTGSEVAPVRGRAKVRGSLAITSRYGSSAMVVGVGRSTRACGGARRRRGIRPNQGGIDQGRCARGIWEWLTGLLGLREAAGDRSPAKAILGLRWGSVGSESLESFTGHWRS